MNTVVHVSQYTSSDKKYVVKHIKRGDRYFLKMNDIVIKDVKPENFDEESYLLVQNIVDDETSGCSPRGCRTFCGFMSSCLVVLLVFIYKEV